MYLDLALSSQYLGALIGYLFFSFFSDNYGRKRGLLVSWTLAVIGNIATPLSPNLLVVGISLFITGAGTSAAMRMMYSFFAEVIENNKRQKYTVASYIVYILASLFSTLLFYLIKSWLVIFIGAVAVPSVIVLAFIFYYVEETPQFLLRRGVETSLKALNRIGKRNLGFKDILEE